jgi:hypothetical protein
VVGRLSPDLVETILGTEVGALRRHEQSRSSRSNSNRFAARVVTRKDTPVILPPGRLRLEINQPQID